MSKRRRRRPGTHRVRLEAGTQELPTPGQRGEPAPRQRPREAIREHRRVHDGECCCRRDLEELVTGVDVGGKKRLDLDAQRVVSLACIRDDAVPILRIARERDLEDCVHRAPAIGRHWR